MSKKQIIKTNDAPQAIGPYSQGVIINGLVYTSGQIPMDPKTGEIVEGIENQAEQALKNVKAVLEAGGSDVEKAVKVTVFIKNMDDFARINEVYKRFFTADFPARSTVEVVRLPLDALVEIEAIGYI